MLDDIAPRIRSRRYIVACWQLYERRTLLSVLRFELHTQLRPNTLLKPSSDTFADSRLECLRPRALSSIYSVQQGVTVLRQLLILLASTS